MSDFDVSAASAAVKQVGFGPLIHLSSAPSTQDEAANAEPGTVVVADVQTAGRGRAGRVWSAEPAAALLCSVVLDAGPEPYLRSLQVGLAVCEAAQGLGADASLKWPNDVLIGDRKLAGVLGEFVAPRVVVGFGINVTSVPDVVGGLTPVSLTQVGISVRRDDLLHSVLGALSQVLSNDRWLDDYRSSCSTIGQTIRLERHSGTITGIAEGIGERGELMVDGSPITVGDVIHVRPQE